MTAMGRESDMLGDAAEVGEPLGDWYVLRVTPRIPSLGVCQPKLVDHAARLRTPDLTRGTSSLPEVGPPMRAEYVIEAVLRRRGFEAWVPCESLWVRQTRYHRARKRVEFRPVVPGHVLVELGPRPNWPRVLDHPMIHGVVGFGGAPARVDCKGMAELRSIERRTQARTYQRFMPTRRVFELGDQVEVLDGPFEGFIVTVVGLTREAAAFEALLFGRVVEGTIPLHKVGKVG